MQSTQLIITNREKLAPAWWRLTLTDPNESMSLQSGQFLLLRCADAFTCYLCRPIFPQPETNHDFTLLIRPDPDPGLAWLATRQVNDKLDVIGPFGQGFDLPNGVQNLLLVSDSQDMAPLPALMTQAVAMGLSVTMALGGRRATTLYPVAALPPVVEFQAATLDGSLGHHGPITDLLPDLLRWADRVCAVGSTHLYQTLRIQAEQIRFSLPADFAFGLVTDVPLPCGVGACLACVRHTQAGLRLACIDGPVFDLAMGW
ncbi:MAG: hypothetical protein KDJ65_10035 [Anaerolineae bacterium]|nr:hypothetical protein [Anaerolineae bacterium]